MIRRRPRKSSDPQSGTPVGIDDWTGFKVPLSALRKEWDNLRTTDPDIRNPQDFVRGVADRMALPFTRPEAPDRAMVTDIDMEDGTPIYSEAAEILWTEGVEAIL